MDIKGTMASLNKLMEEGLIDEAMAQCDKILGGENVPDGLILSSRPSCALSTRKAIWLVPNNPAVRK